jgi:RNA polymerase sigma factor (sigma-70 family)
MSGGRVVAGRQLERLFGAGTVGMLSDAELIERFAADDVDHEAAAAAFEAIVARHGPMILRVCRMVLRDVHAAEDAFQATFLVLARRARTLSRRERLDNWLYGVALRTSRKARIAAARRLARDRAAAILRPEAIIDDDQDDRRGELIRLLHEEIGRLPREYRSAIVTCYLEGLTQAQAASRHRLTESTVRGRIARARALLGHRLSRRGVAPAVALLALENVAEACTTAGRQAAAPCSGTAFRLPDAIVRSMAREALQFARSSGAASQGAVTSTAHALADGVLTTMWLPSLKSIAVAAATAAVAFGLSAAALVGRPTAAAGVGPGSAGAPVTSAVADPAPAADLGSPDLLPHGRALALQRPGRKTSKSGSSARVDKDLAKRAPGEIVRAVPVSKDCTIIAYLPNQNLGHVDNFGLHNYGGGVRVLIDWPAIPAEEAAGDRKFLIAVYSRKTDSRRPSGQIHAFEILEEWPEMNSWSIQPGYDPEPAVTYKFEPGEGWKLFDITPLVHAQAKAGRESHGILLRFLSEDFKPPSGSGYDLVSREGTGEWAGRRPMLLVVKDAKAEQTKRK